MSGTIANPPWRTTSADHRLLTLPPFSTGRKEHR